VGKNGITKPMYWMLSIIYPTVKVISTHLQYKTSNTEKSFFVIDAAFIKNEKTEQVVCSLKGQKKVLKRNGKPYESFQIM
jgi:DNA replication and repair protein RecF